MGYCRLLYDRLDWLDAGPREDYLNKLLTAWPYKMLYDDHLTKINMANKKHPKKLYNYTVYLSLAKLELCPCIDAKNYDSDASESQYSTSL